MDRRKDVLLASAARLYSMGVDLEAARERLRQMVARGVPYDSCEMKQAVRAFQELQRQWEELEKQHLELRDEIAPGKQKADSPKACPSRRRSS